MTTPASSTGAAPVAMIFRFNDSVVLGALDGLSHAPFARTLGDELAFFALHDSYHVGQLGFMRKGLGYPGLAG